jgi:phenylalanyl-tRNA synthetase alpha chain
VDAKDYEAKARSALAGTASLAELEDARRRALGRKSELSRALRSVRDRETGSVLNSLRATLEEVAAERRSELESLEAGHERGAIDVTAPGSPPALGRLHPITVARREVEDIFLGLGYEVREDSEIQTVEDGFDALGYPARHPVRSPRATFALAGGGVLRPETASSLLAALRAGPAPIAAVSIGRCFHNGGHGRSDVFLQLTGVALDRGLSLAHLRGTLETVAGALYGGESEVELCHAYSAFTRPGVDAYVECPACAGAGCRVCRESGRLDFAGGMVDPELLRGAGHDPEEVSAIAFALGVEHNVAQVRHGTGDPRALWRNDLGFLTRA